jgi:hypothetical protein
LLRGGHPGPLSGLDGVDTRRRRVSVRLCFMSMAAVTSRFSFVLEGNCAFLFHHRREEPTLANTEPSAVRHDCAWPDPSRGAGRWGCQTKRLSRQVPVSTPVVYATSSRIGEGNTTFLDPVAEKTIDSRLPVCSGCRHTYSVPDHHRDGGRGGLRTASVVGGVFLSQSLFGDYFLIEFKRPSGSQTLRTWVPDACLVRRALSLRFPAGCDR